MKNKSNPIDRDKIKEILNKLDKQPYQYYYNSRSSPDYFQQKSLNCSDIARLDDGTREYIKKNFVREVKPEEREIIDKYGHPITPDELKDLLPILIWLKRNDII